jgi:hypothetical protein
MGDLIFTGTPAGVGPVKLGDQLEGLWRARKYWSWVFVSQNSASEAVLARQKNVIMPNDNE